MDGYPAGIKRVHSFFFFALGAMRSTWSVLRYCGFYGVSHLDDDGVSGLLTPWSLTQDFSGLAQIESQVGHCRSQRRGPSPKRDLVAGLSSETFASACER